MKPHSSRFRLLVALIALIVIGMAVPTAKAQNAAVSSLLLTFPNTAIGASSTAKSVTLSNSSSTTLKISNIAIAGDFAQTNDCGTSLAGKKSCSISITFKPSGSGLRAGLLTVRDNGGFGIQLTILAGTGFDPVTVSPGSISFGSQAQGVSSAAKSAILKNNQSVAVNITSITSSGDFSQTSNCGSQLAGGATCTVSVIFKPSASGTRTGAVTVVDAMGTELINLNGSGVAPALTSIAITPAAPQLTKGQLQQLKAMGSYSNGTSQDITAAATWTSSSAAIATVGNAAGTKGMVAGVNAGSANVNATMSGMSASAPVTVSAPAVVGISISPDGVSLGIGGQQQFIAMASYADGSVGDVTNLATWTSGNSAVSVNHGLAAVLATPDIAIPVTASMGNLTSAPAWVSALSSIARSCPTPTIDMKLLVVTNGQSEADFPAIKQILDYVGTPYTVLDMSSQGVTADMLSDGQCHAYYQGVIFTVGGYIYQLPGMATLTSYEQTFHIRQVNWYTFPGADFGLTWTGVSLGSDSNTSASFSPAAATVFSYANTATPLNIAGVYRYPASPSSGSVTPLLTDASGNVFSAIYDLGDGREYLTQTFDSNQYMTHDLVLAYGLVNWVTKGIFMGEYHVYATPQVDDVFIDDHEWQANTPCYDSTPAHDRTDADADNLTTFRMNATDVDKLVAWQIQKQQNPLLSKFVLHMAFNGMGTTGDINNGGYSPDTLTPEFKKFQSSFKWISHTWDHPDTLNGMNAAEVAAEIDKNNAAATSLGLTYYNRANMVTPGITGLNDATFVNTAVADGLRYVVTDTSVLNTPNNGPNPSPNVGIVNTINSGLYMVPRHANNLFFNVATPGGWVAEYQCIYAGQAPYSNFNYQQVLDNISQSFVSDMLRGDMDPQMFHQPNLHAYDAQGHSLIGDLYDATFNNYLSLYKLPVLSPTLDQLAQSMQKRDQFNQSGATASYIGGSNPTIKITIPSGAAVPSAVIPVTGLSSTGAEVYGGQNISHVQVGTGQTVTLPVQ